MRTKQLEYDNEKFTIAPLTVEQTEKFAEATVDLDSLDDKGKAAAARARACEIVCYGLNNAQSAVQWTPERCRTEMDQWLLFRLQSEILEFSRLTASAAGEEAARTAEPGEKTRAAVVN